MPPKNVETFPQVLYSNVRDSLNKLWDVLWNMSGGSSTWYKWKTAWDYEAYVEWVCYDNQFLISQIHGNLPHPYQIEVHGSSVELTLPYRRFTFSSHHDYGAFAVPGTVALKQGSAYYVDRFTDEPLEHFFDRPYQGVDGTHRFKHLMTSTYASEADMFLSDLAARIERAKSGQ